MRLFVCSFLGEDAQTFYERLLADPIATSGGLLRNIPPRSAHITYAFMASVDEHGLGEIVEAVSASVTQHDPIAIQLDTPRIQYARREARLVYAPVNAGAPALTRLTADIVGEMERRFGDVAVRGSRSPHVTLARFRRRTHRHDAAAIIEPLLRSRIGTTTCDDRIGHVQIVASVLAKEGPRYEIRASLPLRGGPIT